ncbi:phosphoethanolamine transferase [Simplicispira lacusdiani]|uniref:phosphoethanolamine transferase n=1 Tax=Simplicispira lacusdiani TaxID=2213010 RepID=UPI001E57F799|nr:phosphoethanolamine--lipid A transferase [Simplicispira lacusdiani]
MPLTAPLRAPWHPTALLLVLALWLATLGNFPLWTALWRLPEMHGPQAVATLGLLVLVVLAATLLLLSLLVWPRWLKPAGLLLLTITASSSYFMASYGIVIDPTMATNVVQTDMGEALDLLSWPLLVTLTLGAALPGIWWWRQPVRAVGAVRLAGQQLGAGLLGLLVAVALLWTSFQDVASLMRNHKQLRYMVNPFNTVYAVGRVAVGRTTQAQKPLRPLGEDARGPAATGTDPDGAPLIVLVVGETARAANFGLGGYGRDTTPRLQALQGQGDLVYFSNVSSCGTNTQTSVPCMFSHLGRDGYADASERHENLLDVLQRAGLAVLWLDNQSGCKGVCERVPNVDTRALDFPDVCPDGQCLDEAMLRQLPQELSKLPAERRARGTVVVMHQMGSHGPAYYKRSPQALKRFLPECTSHALQECPVEHIQNAYDNSLRYTDHFLAETVQWLQAQKRPTALLYLSDHGESLGEKGLYLHGMPYRMAPKEQTQVPMLAWISKPLQQDRHWDMACLRAKAGQPWSHDNLFHTLLDVASIHTQVHVPALDILSDCARPA